MGHVKQKKSTSSSTSTPPEPLAIEVNYKDNVPSHRENRYPEQLNAEELISQINCSRNISSNANEVTNSNNRNDSNNNSNNNNNNNTIHRANQHCNTHDESVDVEKASERRSIKQRPLYRRLFSFIRNLWIGAKFNVGKADCELEELEAPQRYRPDSLAQICKTTRFSEPEIKRMYRGFKSHCPNGMVKEDTFKIIYAQFFPQGANTGLYAHYIFNTLDKDHTGTLSFEKFVQGLSILSRGSLEEKLCWTFQLYDINSDGHITREEMSDIVTAVYGLMGHPLEDKINEETIKERVESMFNKMDRNHDGVVTIDEFLDCCRCDKAIMNSMLVFDSTI
ncbi:Kv channel-interacting protein 4-like [Chironomus tepperi]|uniref:Kv channel-interacting protein 4-like n=1 Tax=Chironomus tepperi TaxID=113505 RepID=UPI00391F5B1F